MGSHQRPGTQKTLCLGEEEMRFLIFAVLIFLGGCVPDQYVIRQRMNIDGKDYYQKTTIKDYGSYKEIKSRGSFGSSKTTIKRR